MVSGERIGQFLKPTKLWTVCGNRTDEKSQPIDVRTLVKAYNGGVHRVYSHTRYNLQLRVRIARLHQQIIVIIYTIQVRASTIRRRAQPDYRRRCRCGTGICRASSSCVILRLRRSRPEFRDLRYAARTSLYRCYCYLY